VKATYYICALPVETLKEPLIPDGVREADEHFSTLWRLPTAWMNGVMFYLRDDVPQVHGHTIYVDSHWALTSISQQQFWRTRVEDRGDGRAHGILSVDVSDWKSGESAGRVASRSTKNEIKEEVLAQLARHLEGAPSEQILRSNLHSWFMDPAITYPNPSHTANAEPLLINKPNSYRFRPRVDSAIENLFVAADFAQTDTDLACMEGANEAARKAVNAILERHGQGDPCLTWDWDPMLLKGVRVVDEQVARAAGLARAVTPGWLRDRLEQYVSPRIGARVADRLTIGEITQPGASVEELLTEREQGAFADDLVYSPDDTLADLEGRLLRSRERLAEVARQELER
jgi:hypothetical protein